MNSNKIRAPVPMRQSVINKEDNFSFNRNVQPIKRQSSFTERLNQNFVILHYFVNLMSTKNTFIWQKKFKTNLLDYLNKVENIRQRNHSNQNCRLFPFNAAVLKLGVTTLFRVAKYY